MPAAFISKWETRQIAFIVWLRGGGKQKDFYFHLLLCSTKFHFNQFEKYSPRFYN